IVEITSSFFLLEFISPLFYFIGSAQAVEDLKREFISAQSDKPVTLDCKLEHQTGDKNQFWYKLISGQEPQEVATKLKEKDTGSLSLGFDKLGFKLHDNFSLTIEQPNKAHEGMYFCGQDGNTNKFSKGTFVAVKAFQTLSPGEAVNLQCTVQPNNQPADQQVFWFRSSAGRSFPEIIFTHHSSSSSSSSSSNRQCEISSSKDGCVFNFTKNIFNTTDTGTYYCAVASCGRIIIGDGTPVDFSKLYFFI
uniref:Ig-like domain-containing protein n=1 Tax=Astyanax mexicanus TaxID=7994 RepID=A0A3B1ILK0_ASTMX